MFLEYLIQEYNDEYFLCSVAKTMYNKNIEYNFWDFLSNQKLEDKIGKHNYRRLEDKLDIKNFIKLQKKFYLILKIILNKNSKFMFKLLTKTYQDKEHFIRYF